MGACSRTAGSRRLLLSALVLASAGGPRSRSLAQQVTTCGATGQLRVENLAGATALNAAVNCAGGGNVEAIWAGAVTLGSPISVGSGTFLSITGEDELAEAQGGSQTRMFDVSPSGGLSLTQLKLSGGSAPSGGAVYSSDATVTLDGCVFDGNLATAGDGGAVWVEGGDLTIVGGEFSGNTASGNGGAVLALDAAVAIQDGTRFDGNKAIEGGGVFCGGKENSTTAATATCSLSDAIFASNNASSEIILDYDIFEAPWTNLYGGGAAAFYQGVVDITDSVFELNYAQLSGGAVYGGTGSDMTIDGCTFEENWTQGFGGGMAASSATLGTNTVVHNNSADANGAGVFGWDEDGAIELNEVVCTDNTAIGNGGCFYVSGGGVVNDGTVMQRNQGKYGGCLYAFGGGEDGTGGCDLDVLGGEFTTCLATANGAFMFASDGALVTVVDATVTNSVATRRGGVVYCSGDSFDRGGSAVTIEGGTFRDNKALELGGAFVAWGEPTVLTITGGSFSNNTAKFYGGFMFLEEGASLSCEGATIADHYAGDQGGAIYGRDATWVNSSCDLIGNGAPQGAAAYLTHTVGAARFENHEVRDNVASGGSVLYATETSVLASGVSFQSSVGLQEDSSNRAVQLEGEATFYAEGCAFGGWMGDSVIHSANTAPGSLVLNSCDFGGSTAVMMVASPYSDAEIRNAGFGHHSIDNAATVNGSLVLVDRALDCDDPNACGPGECVDSVLGVLCECLEGGACLNDGGALSIGVKKPPPNVTYSPEPVYFELVVSAAADGTTAAIWNLTYEADDLDLTPFPCSGILPPGENVTVIVTGQPLRQDVGGTLVSRFVATSVGSGNSDSTTGVDLEVESNFYLCQAFEYAMPADGGGVTCEQCVTFNGADGLDCARPGATLASLPVKPGYWRSSRESQVVHLCIHPDSCAGATQVASSDDYCEAGYEGPYCASCQSGYGRAIGSTCHSCEDKRSRWLIFAGALLTLIAALFLVLAVVFLIGGLDAVEEVRRSVTRTLSVSANKAPTFWKSAPRDATSAGAGPPPGSSADSTVHDAGVTPAFAPEFVPAARSGPATAQEAKDDFRDERQQQQEPRQLKTIIPVDFSEQGSVSDTVVVDGLEGFPATMPSRTTASYAGRSAARPPPIPAARDGEGGEEADVARTAACCGLGDKIKRWASLVPMDKLKILVVVWQILTVFPSITGTDFPPAYARFLSWIDVVNLDVGSIFSGTCLLPRVTFYERLLLTTLAPLGLAVVLTLTFQLAKRRAGIGSASVISKRAAWSRHMAAGLLLTFLVFTSTSTVIFKTFACDEEAVEGESYLRADYSLSCNTSKHTWYKAYAGIMLVVYPIGIPALYAYILFVNRHALNPQVRAEDSAVDPGLAAHASPAEIEERIQKRRQNPDLVPSMFLWKDFDPDLYYYEVIECGRRILLTGVLIFIAPHTPAQAAMACIFAFASLLGFELLRPHLDPADSWLYRLGCVVIFLSNFVALLIKVDAAGEHTDRSVLGGIMIAVNVFLILAVLSTSWFATQQAVDDQKNGESAFDVARAMLTHEQLAADSKRSERAATASSLHRAASAAAARQDKELNGGGGGLNGAGEGGSMGGSGHSSSLGAGLLRAVGPAPARRPSRTGVGRMFGSGSAGGGGVSAALVEELWEEDKAMGSSAHAH